MNIRSYVKNYSPAWLYRFAKNVYGLTSVPRYWIPYALMKGTAFPPAQLTLELTYKCNLNCIMCPQAIDRRKDESVLRKNIVLRPEISTDRCLSLIDEMAKMKIKKITVTGGEPLLRGDALEILGHAKKRGLQCVLLSNGVLITEEIARKIVARKIDQVTFSLDGPRDVHHTVRQSPQAFERLVSAIQLLQKEKKRAGAIVPHLSLTCTISALNASRLSETFKIAQELNVNMHYGYLYYSTPEMEAKTNKILQMGKAKDEDQNVSDSLKAVDIHKLQDEIRAIKRLAKGSGIKVSFQPDLNEAEVVQRFQDETFAYASKCLYPWYAVRVNPYGDVYPCSMGKKIGNINEQRLDALWNNDIYIQFRTVLRREKLFPKCVKCCALNNKLWSHLPSFVKK